MIDGQTDTSLQTLHNLSKQFIGGNLPDFAKEASSKEDNTVIASAPSNAFGDTHRRMFPCHTKSATYVSCLYFFGQEANHVAPAATAIPHEKIAHRLTNAAAYWNLQPELATLRASIAERTKQAVRELKDSDFAMVVDYGDERIRRFPCVNEGTTKIAAEALTTNRVQYPYEWRRKAARNILHKAAELHVSLPSEHSDYLIRAASMYPTDCKKAAIRLTKRAAVFPAPERQKLRAAAACLSQGSNAESMIKMCEILDGMDREHTMYPMYRQGMPMPEEMLFNNPILDKSAAVIQPELVTLTTGVSFDLGAIKQAGIEPFTVLGDSMLSEVADGDAGALNAEKVAAILPTLPRPEAELIERAFNAVGVPNYEAEKSAAEGDSPYRGGDLLAEDEWDKFFLRNNHTTSKDFGITAALSHPQSVNAVAAK